MKTHMHLEFLMRMDDHLQWKSTRMWGKHARFRSELGLLHYDLGRVASSQNHLARRARQNLVVLGSLCLVGSR